MTVGVVNASSSTAVVVVDASWSLWWWLTVRVVNAVGVVEATQGRYQGQTTTQRL